MEEFLTVLKTCLMESLTPAELDGQMALYREYFDDELASGKSMEQILRKLGEPAKVAELIVKQRDGVRLDEEAAQQQHSGRRFCGDCHDCTNMTEEEIAAVNAQVQNPEHGFHAEFKANEGWDVRLGKLKLNTWYGTLIILGIVLAIFVLISQLMHR